MDIRILYYYYVDKVRKPDVNEFMDENQNYRDFYEKENNEILDQPKDIDDVLDIYNERKKDFEDGLYFTDIFYLIVDFDNMVATEELIKRTEKDKKFKGWINRDTETYEKVHATFMGTGRFERDMINIKKIN